MHSFWITIEGVKNGEPVVAYYIAEGNNEDEAITNVLTYPSVKVFDSIDTVNGRVP